MHDGNLLYARKWIYTTHYLSLLYVPLLWTGGIQLATNNLWSISIKNYGN